MVGRPISLTPAHDRALVKLAKLRGKDWTASKLVREWIRVHAQRKLRVRVSEPVRKPWSRQGSLALRINKSAQTRQLRLKLRKPNHKPIQEP